MPLSALPENYQHGKDWLKSPAQKLWKEYWFYYSPRCPEGEKDWITLIGIPFTPWRICLPIRIKTKWREVPKVLFAVRGKGQWRAEAANPDIEEINFDTDRTIINTHFYDDYYLSTIQYWTKWAFWIQWPFHIGFHIYRDDQWWYLTRRPKNAKLWINFRFGARRDQDRIYSFPSFFIGTRWN